MGEFTKLVYPAIDSIAQSLGIELKRKQRSQIRKAISGINPCRVTMEMIIKRATLHPAGKFDVYKALRDYATRTAPESEHPDVLVHTIMHACNAGFMLESGRDIARYFREPPFTHTLVNNVTQAVKTTGDYVYDWANAGDRQLCERLKQKSRFYVASTMPVDTRYRHIVSSNGFAGAQVVGLNTPVERIAWCKSAGRKGEDTLKVHINAGLSMPDIAEALSFFNAYRSEFPREPSPQKA